VKRHQEEKDKEIEQLKARLEILQNSLGRITHVEEQIKGFAELIARGKEGLAKLQEQQEQLKQGGESG
jgi:archaellum component FlaC